MRNPVSNAPPRKSDAKHKNPILQALDQAGKAEERTHLCEHCVRRRGTHFFDRKWICPQCHPYLEGNLLLSELYPRKGKKPK